MFDFFKGKKSRVVISESKDNNGVDLSKNDDLEIIHETNTLISKRIDELMLT